MENTCIGQVLRSTVGPDFSNLFWKYELVRIIKEIERSRVNYSVDW